MTVTVTSHCDNRSAVGGMATWLRPRRVRSRTPGVPDATYHRPVTSVTYTTHPRQHRHPSSAAASVAASAGSIVIGGSIVVGGGIVFGVVISVIIGVVTRVLIGIVIGVASASGGSVGGGVGSGIVVGGSTPRRPRAALPPHL